MPEGSPFAERPNAAHQASRTTFTSFKVGRGVGLISERSLALLEPSNGELSETLWHLIERGADIDDLLEALSATGLRSLGAFALAQFETSSIRVVVRGTAIAELVLDGAPIIVNAVGVRTWVEEVVPDASALTMRLRHSNEEASPFRLNAGIVPADLLSRGAVAASDLQSLYLTWAADEVAGFARTTLTPSARLPPPRPGTEQQLPTPIERATPRVDLDRTISPREFEASNDLGRVDATPPGMPSAGGTPERDHDVPMRAHSSGALIEGVPQSGIASAETTLDASARPLAPPLGDHDGHTISKAQLEAMRSSQRSVPPAQPNDLQPSMGGPSVPAVLCPNRHGNPPHLSTCRNCGAPLDGRSVLIARPTLGSMRFSDGRVVTLDKPLLIGRNPKLEGRMPSEIPTLLKLDLAQGLSRTHAVVRLEGWQVLLEDLDSANGTIVTLPGREPQRLHPREPAILEHGATIDFGGELSATYVLL